jgi:hypothetical protein
MSFVQTTYTENPAAAVAGMPADADYSADTRIVETAAGIGFGVAVSQGTADKGALVGGASAAVFAGVSIRDKTVVNTTTPDLYTENANMGVMTRGDIWVTVGGDVVAGGDATFVATTGVLSSAAASGSQFAIAGGRWMTSASSGGLAILRLSGHVPAA